MALGDALYLLLRFDPGWRIIAREVRIQGSMSSLHVVLASSGELEHGSVPVIRRVLVWVDSPVKTGQSACVREHCTEIEKCSKISLEGQLTSSGRA